VVGFNTHPGLQMAQADVTLLIDHDESLGSPTKQLVAVIATQVVVDAAAPKAEFT